MANWSVEEPDAQVWAPASCFFPVDIFGTCSLQAHVPESSAGQQQQQLQLVEYYAAATVQHEQEAHDQSSSQQVALRNSMMEMEIYNNPSAVLQEVAHAFKIDIDLVKVKMHTFPAIIRDLGDLYTVPRMVAIGPYHHGREQLRNAEQAKYAAVHHCTIDAVVSGRSMQEMFDAVVSAIDARRLYDDKYAGMVGISSDDFQCIMFCDACFLVQYMLWHTDEDRGMDPSLRSFFDLNRKVLRTDVMLLENQVPWGVVEAVMSIRPVDLKQFVFSLKDMLETPKPITSLDGYESFALDGYEPEHLLGLLRHYIVGTRQVPPNAPDVDGEMESVLLSVSAMELAEIGITLEANETGRFIDMGIRNTGIFSAELSLAPLSLNKARATRLVNMAALELCTTPRFLDADDEKSAVCSYLHLLSMLVHREEDVQELRTRHILQGAGLTNKEALDFFTSFQDVPHGGYCADIMLEIGSYKVKRPMQTKVHTYYHRRKESMWKVLSAIVVVLSIIGSLVGIFVKLMTLRRGP